MEINPKFSRRALVKSSIFGILATSIPNITFAKTIISLDDNFNQEKNLFQGYPAIDDEIVAEVVGKSHFDLDRVKALVDARPELARAAWDWGFGDWETAIGAASHVGRHDIVTYLISKGARPDIFTYAMLGAYDAVKAMIENTPGIQSIAGPHGISLLSHAKIGMRSKTISEGAKANAQKLVDYLEALGNADPRDKDIEMSLEKKKAYVGDYMYGENENQGFSIKINRRNMLSLGKIGKFGGGLFQVKPGVFNYNGTSSVKITFQLVADKIVSLTVEEPELTLVAKRI